VVHQADPYPTDQLLHTRQSNHLLKRTTRTTSNLGHHDDCFRFWEAVQSGSIPVLVRRVWGFRKGQAIDQAHRVVRVRWRECGGGVRRFSPTDSS
jgi:hypothetical protein